MGKYEFINSKNIVPVAKTLKLEYEDGYGGEVKVLEAKIYPFTVTEKIEAQETTKVAQALIESKNKNKVEEGQAMLTESTYKSVYYVLKKDDPTITIEIVKKLPVAWISDIIYTALEFEGIDRKQVESQKK